MGRSRPRKHADNRKKTIPAGSVAPGALSQKWIFGALLATAAFIAYFPAYSAGFIWDDDDYVTGNMALRSLDGLRQIWFVVGTTPQYYPLVHTAFWAEYQLWGLNASGYHVINVIFHTLNSVLLWRVLLALRIPGAPIAALIFALHPVHVESVAWITERKNVLSGFFYLASLASYLRFASDAAGAAASSDATGAAPPARVRWRAYAASLFLFVCALLSKTVTASLPVVILLILWWKRGRVAWREFTSLLPFFAIGFAFGILTIWVEKHNVGATGAEYSFSFVERLLIAGRALWFYPAKLLAPISLAFVYPRWEIRPDAVWQYFFPIAAALLFLGLLIFLRRIGRAPFAAAAAYAVTIFPALGFINVFPMQYTFVADHYQYLASIALITPAAALVHTRLLPLFGGNYRQAYAVVGAACGLLAMLTWNQAGIYHDLETLWRDTLTKNPRASIAHNNLGNILTDRGNFEEAEPHYRAALEINPDDDFAHYNLGTGLLRNGRVEEAVVHLQEAIRLRPRYVEAHYNLGTALQHLGKPPEAAQAYESALRLQPDFTQARLGLAVALSALGQTEAAKAHYRQALAEMPELSEVHFNFAMLLSSEGNWSAAAAHFGEAVRLDPADAEAKARLQEARSKAALDSEGREG